METQDLLWIYDERQGGLTYILYGFHLIIFIFSSSIIMRGSSKTNKVCMTACVRSGSVSSIQKANDPIEKTIQKWSDNFSKESIEKGQKKKTKKENKEVITSREWDDEAARRGMKDDDRIPQSSTTGHKKFGKICVVSGRETRKAYARRMAEFIQESLESKVWNKILSKTFERVKSQWGMNRGWSKREGTNVKQWRRWLKSVKKGTVFFRKKSFVEMASMTKSRTSKTVENYSRNIFPSLSCEENDFCCNDFLSLLFNQIAIMTTWMAIWWKASKFQSPMK